MGAPARGGRHDRARPRERDLRGRLRRLQVHVASGFIARRRRARHRAARFAFDGVTVAWSRIDGLEDGRPGRRALPDRRSGRPDPLVPRPARVLAVAVPRGRPIGQRLRPRGRRTQRGPVRGPADPGPQRGPLPRHKWLLRVLRDVPEQPPGLGPAIEAVIERPGTRHGRRAGRPRVRLPRLGRRRPALGHEVHARHRARLAARPTPRSPSSSQPNVRLAESSLHCRSMRACPRLSPRRQALPALYSWSECQSRVRRPRARRTAIASVAISDELRRALAT